MRKLSVWIIVLALFAAIPVSAADRVIYNGVDLWRTVGNGATYADFSETAIPAGFFCHKSEPFTGRIAFKGVPVATNVPGALGLTDTIVQRLDDATFNKKGVAFTRIQVRSLNFESIAPVKTACGLFTAKVALDGEQPVTRMRIVRESAAGGRFFAPIHVNVKISFTPIGKPAAEPLEISKIIRFPPLPNQKWASQPTPTAAKYNGFLLVDTDGDLTPDTYLPGTSNFGVGQALDKGDLSQCQFSPDNPIIDCHQQDNCTHCIC
ncbi:MAG TPA: hypothetical protein VF789_33615 [Thermoanaerobaculia bacterium]